MAFADGPDGAVGDRLATLVARSSRVMALLALDNPASDLELWVGVQTAASTAGAQPGTRAIVLVADDPAPKYRVRRQGEPRSVDNSLVLEMQVDRPAYLTVVSVDTEGGVYQLFPNPHQRPGFYPEGLVPANTLIRVPDARTPGNAAGFYWDYSPPVGKDTVRVFAAADLATARTIRRFIADASTGTGALQQLGTALAAANVRGVRVSVDEEQAAAVPPPAPGMVTPTAPLPGAPAQPPLAGSWSAASVVIEVTE